MEDTTLGSSVGEGAASPPPKGSFTPYTQPSPPATATIKGAAAAAAGSDQPAYHSSGSAAAAAEKIDYQLEEVPLGSSSHHSMVVKEESEVVLRWWQSPYWQIIVYGIACLTTSCIYFGWQPYQEMLFRGGAYEWKCAPDHDFDSLGPCLEQDKAVTRLYSWAQGSEGACAFIAGLLLDHLGPRKTAILGEVLFGLAILMISVSSQSFQMYIPAMLISGGCVNIVAFPSLVVCEAWPSRQALAVSVIVGAQSGASVIAPILKTIWDNNPQYSYFGIWGVYLLAVWLPVSVLYIWTLPAKRNYGKLVKPNDAAANATLEEGEDNGKEALAVEQPAAQAATPPVTSKAKWKAFWRDLRTIDLIVCSIYTFLLMLQFAYYPSVVRDAISTEMSDFVGWMTPLQAPFSIVIGFATDYTGTVTVMFAMCATLLTVSLLAGLAADYVGWMRFTSILFVFMQSATFNIKYTFVNELYDPFNFGKLVGFLGIMGGIGVYVNAPIASSTAYREIFLTYAGVAVFMALLTFLCYWRQHKLGISHKTIEGVEQKGYNIKKKKDIETETTSAVVNEEEVV